MTKVRKLSLKREAVRVLTRDEDNRTAAGETVQTCETKPTHCGSCTCGCNTDYTGCCGETVFCTCNHGCGSGG